MAATRNLRSTRIKDENAVVKPTNMLKTFAPTEMAKARRAALGDIGNRGSNVQSKDALGGPEKPAFKHIKPRVDCWIGANPVKSTAVQQPQNKRPVQRVSSRPKSNDIVAKPESIAQRKLQVVLPQVKKEPKNDIVCYSSRLLNNVENIDEHDGNNHLLLSEYVHDMYDYLFEQENSFHRIAPDYLEKHMEATPKMRSVLFDWLNEVHLQFKLMPETFFLTVGIIDRFLQASPMVKRKQLQLVGVSAMLIAAKYEDIMPPTIADFIYITDNSYNDKDIREMEKSILRALDFQISLIMVPITFLRRFSKAAKAEERHHLMAKYFIELASIDYSFAHQKSSEIAAASLLLALLTADKHQRLSSSVWTSTLEFYTTYNFKELLPIALRIAQLAINAPTAKLKSVYTKFASSKFLRISINSEMLDLNVLETLYATLS